MDYFSLHSIKNQSVRVIIRDKNLHHGSRWAPRYREIRRPQVLEFRPMNSKTLNLRNSRGHHQHTGTILGIRPQESSNHPKDPWDDSENDS